MGLRLSLFSRPAAKADDKEGSQEAKAEVTPLTPSQPTPIAAEAGAQDQTQSKCHCSDCKCDPCNCPHDKPSEAAQSAVTESPETANDTQVKAEEQTNVTENVETPKSDEVIRDEESAKEVGQTESQPDVPQEEPQQAVSEVHVESEQSQVPSEAESQPVQQSEEVKDESSAEATTESKCLCSPCECNPCKCGHHEHEVTEESQPQPTEESHQVPAAEEAITSDQSAAPEPQSVSETPVESTENAEQINSEVKELAEADQQIVDNPEVSQELVPQNEQ